MRGIGTSGAGVGPRVDGRAPRAVDEIRLVPAKSGQSRRRVDEEEPQPRFSNQFNDFHSGGIRATPRFTGPSAVFRRAVSGQIHTGCVVRRVRVVAGAKRQDRSTQCGHILFHNSTISKRRTSSHRGRNGFSPHKKVPVQSHNDISRPLVPVWLDSRLALRFCPPVGNTFAVVCSAHAPVSHGIVCRWAGSLHKSSSVTSPLLTARLWLLGGGTQ